MSFTFTSVILRKSLADITQRKGRAVLVTLGIFIGILGLTAVNTTNDVVGGAFIYSHDQSSNPDMAFSAPAVDASVIGTLLRIPNVARVQLRSEYYSSWHLHASPSSTGSASIQINGYADLQHIQLGTFQLTAGRLPGAGEIVMDSRDNAIQPVAIGDTVTIDTPGGTASLRVAGLARTPGWATTDSGGQATGYMQASDLQQIVGQSAIQTGAPASKSKAQGGPQLKSVVMAKVRDTQQAMPTYQAVEQALTQAGVKVTDGSLYDTTSGAIAVNGMLVVIRVLALVALLSTCMLVVNTMNENRWRLSAL